MNGTSRRNLFQLCIGAFFASGARSPVAATGRDFGPTFTAWRGLEIATGDTCILPAGVNGFNTRAILDSGSGATVIDARFADRVHLTGGETRTLTGLSGKIQGRILRDVSIELDLDVRRAPVVIVGDLGSIAAALGRPVELLLGADVFADRCLALDFAGGRFATASSGAFTGGQGWQRLALAKGAKRELTVTASVAGSPPVQLMVDTGSSTALMLSTAFLKEQGLLEGRRISSAVLGGIEGTREVTALTLDRLTLAGLDVTAVPTLGLLDWQPTGPVGNIGLPVIGQFGVVFDVSRDSLWLRSGPTVGRLPLLKDRSGLGFAVGADGLTIMHVAAGSPAASGRWRMGDRIVRVDGTPISPGYTRDGLWRWRYRSAGTPVRLELADGEKREILLADYF